MVVVVALVGARAALVPTPITITEGLAWLIFAVGPPAVLRFLFQATPSTIAQVLYDTEHPDEAVTSPVAHHGSKG